MSDFIEDFYYGNIEPQECTTNLTAKVKKRKRGKKGKRVKKAKKEQRIKKRKRGKKNKPKTLFSAGD